MIFGILQIWHTHLWHQHISEMTSSFFFISHDICPVTSVTKYSNVIHSYYTILLKMWQSYYGMSVVFDIHDIYIYDMCISDMTSALIIWVFLQHDMHIDDVCILEMVMSEKQWCYKCCCHVGKTRMPECRCHEKNTLMSSMYMSCLKKTLISWM
jgi:hypothetical protein